MCTGEMRLNFMTHVLKDGTRGTKFGYQESMDGFYEIEVHTRRRNFGSDLIQTAAYGRNCEIIMEHYPYIDHYEINNNDFGGVKRTNTLMQNQLTFCLCEKKVTLTVFWDYIDPKCKSL